MSDANSTFLDALAANQNTERNKLHELETSDVAISREALSALGKAARSLLVKVMGAGSVEAMTIGEIVKLFASKLYWNETGGELIMCADFEGRTVCLPIPAEHWNVNITGQLQ
ncbi:MAG: hypothetical protein ACOZEN_00915 [Thermodesulfobacteriota bacterium]